MKVWTLGDAVIDLLPQGEMQFSACAGALRSMSLSVPRVWDATAVLSAVSATIPSAIF